MAVRTLDSISACFDELTSYVSGTSPYTTPGYVCAKVETNFRRQLNSEFVVGCESNKEQYTRLRHAAYSAYIYKLDKKLREFDESGDSSFFCNGDVAIEHTELLLKTADRIEVDTARTQKTLEDVRNRLKYL